MISLAFGAMRSVLTDKTVRRIFLIFGISYLATQMSRPYIPVLVEDLTGSGAGLASAIALVMGAAALVGALVSPLGGLIGDRIGFRPVLIAALACGGVILLLMPLAPAVPALALLAVVLGVATATVTSMIFGLLALDVPADRRSATLNLVYLPLYAAGIIGPAVGRGAGLGRRRGRAVHRGRHGLPGRGGDGLRPRRRDLPRREGDGRGLTGSAPGRPARPARLARAAPLDDDAGDQDRDDRRADEGGRLAGLDPAVLGARDHQLELRVFRLAGVLVVRGPPGRRSTRTRRASRPASCQRASK